MNLLSVYLALNFFFKVYLEVTILNKDWKKLYDFQLTLLVEEIPSSK